MHPYPGFRQVDRSQAQEDRDGRHDFEVDNRAQSQPSNLPQVRVPGDANHQRRKQQGSDDRLNQPQENHCEHAQVRGRGGEVVANLGSE